MTLQESTHQTEVEASLLGAILLAETVLPAVLVDERLGAGDFSEWAHRVVFEAFVSLHNAGRPIDVLTVTEQLRATGELDAVGGAAAVDALAGAVPAAGNVREYARLVKAQSVRRTIAAAGRELQVGALDPATPTGTLVDRAERTLLELSANGERKPVRHIREVVAPALDRYEKRRSEGTGFLGIRTGFQSLDEALGGFEAGRLYVLAARPSMGKSSWMLDSVTSVSVDQGKHSLIVALEMSEDEVNDGLIARQAGVRADALSRGLFNADKWQEIAAAAARVSEAPIWIADSNATIADIRTKARALAARVGLDFIAVDYLQLIAEEGLNRGRVDEVSAFSRGLKMLARELNVPVLALSQLSRKVEERNDKRPLLSDLRESGQIEADADVVLMLFRLGYYDRQCDDPGLTELLIRKARQSGDRSTIGLRFSGRSGRYVDEGAIS